MSLSRFRLIVSSVAVVILVALGVALWWIFTPSHTYKARPQSGDELRVIADSAEVRRLIAADETMFPEAERAKLTRKPDGYPEQVQFLEGMHRQPATVVAADSYARLLIRSKAPCESDPSLSATFVKVRITSGDQNGLEGWVCSDDLQATILTQRRRDGTVTILTAGIDTPEN
jgi:hypothetical protein